MVVLHSPDIHPGVRRHQRLGWCANNVATTLCEALEIGFLVGHITIAPLHIGEPTTHTQLSTPEDETRS